MGIWSWSYIDLDHFKAFNDRYGFVCAGDAMIRTLAEILRYVLARARTASWAISAAMTSSRRLTSPIRC